MAAKRKQPKPSNNSQRVSEDSWYYESPSRIELVVWVTEPRTKYRTATTVRIPWWKLLRSAKRCGKIASNEGTRTRRAVPFLRKARPSRARQIRALVCGPSRLGVEVIRIEKSETADTRTCDFANVSRETLKASSEQHIRDVHLALGFFAQMLHRTAAVHDTDKLTDLDGFHADFITGFKQAGWWERHRSLNRHHLMEADGVPADVNLIDVLDYVADCVMAGMARSGSVRPLELPEGLLQRAFENTAKLLASHVVVDAALSPHSSHSNQEKS